MSDWDMPENGAAAVVEDAGDDWDAAAPAPASPETAAANDRSGICANNAQPLPAAASGDAENRGASDVITECVQPADKFGGFPPAGSASTWGETRAGAFANDFNANSGAVQDTGCASLFIGNLSWHVDEAVLRREFEEFGAITSTRVISDQDTGRSKGFGYVEFANSVDAAKAMAGKNGAVIDGRQMRIDFSTPRDKPARSSGGGGMSFGGAKNPQSDTIFVGGMSYDTNEDIIREAFGAHGTVTEVRIPTDPATGNPKGYAYVNFASVEDAMAAMENMHGADIAGRNIRLDYATVKAPRAARPIEAPTNPESDKLFVGNVSDQANEDTLREAFGAHGIVTDVFAPTDQNTGNAKGFAYVTFASVEEAINAVQNMNGADIAGRNIRLDYAAAREERAPRAARPIELPSNPPSETLFVGNVSGQANEDILLEVFGAHGTTTSVRIPTDQDTGNPKRFAYVTFSSVEEAMAAVEALNGADIAGRNIRLDYAAAREERAPREARRIEPPTNPESNTLFVGSISFDANEDIIREAFAPHGTVVDVRIPTDTETGSPKGFAYVTFASVEDTIKAVENMNGADIAGRNIHLDYAAARDNGPRGGQGGEGFPFGGREPLDRNKPFPPRIPDIASTFDPNEGITARAREFNTYVAAEVNVPDRFELFLLQDGEKKITEQIDTRTPNSSIFTILKEDHTLCNLLRAHLLKDPAVLFAGYKIPHPLFAKVELRVQTDGSITPKEAVISCSKKLVSDLGQFSREFTKEFELRKMVANASAAPHVQNGQI